MESDPGITGSQLPQRFPPTVKYWTRGNKTRHATGVSTPKCLHHAGELYRKIGSELHHMLAVVRSNVSPSLSSRISPFRGDEGVRCLLCSWCLANLPVLLIFSFTLNVPSISYGQALAFFVCLFNFSLAVAPKFILVAPGIIRDRRRSQEDKKSPNHEPEKSSGRPTRIYVVIYFKKPVSCRANMYTIN